MSNPNRIHTQETKNKALELYFAIEKHFALGGAALRLWEVRDMLGLKSNSTTLIYVRLLNKWKLIKHNPNTVATITLANKHYPPVEYRDLKGVHVGTRK